MSPVTKNLKGILHFEAKSYKPNRDLVLNSLFSYDQENMDVQQNPLITEGSVSLLSNQKSMDSLLTELTRGLAKYNDYEFPKVSIVIPTYNCAQSITPTLDSLLDQDYPDYEVIIVDAGSTDRTLEIIKGYRHDKIRIYTVSGYQRYEMLNKGISQSSGNYLNFMFPGDFYIYRETLKYMMSLALTKNRPSLVFCGTLLRDGKSEVKILYRHLSLKLLKRGQQPTSLQSIWFSSHIFKELGKFNSAYSLRGGYEFLCRFALHKGLKAASTNWVLTDYDLRLVTRKMVICHFIETFKTMFNFFGWAATFKWLVLYQKDMKRIFNLWKRAIRSAFVGK